jgi:hypothetical protein
MSFVNKDNQEPTALIFMNAYGKTLGAVSNGSCVIIVIYMDT